MDLLSATSRIKKALSRRDYIADLSAYHLREGQMFAANGALTASVPVEEALEHVIPADELDKALSILGNDAKLAWSAETLVMKKGKRRITIRLLKPEATSLQEPVQKRYDVTANFVSSMKKIRPFLSEDASRPWALTAWLHKGPADLYVWTATNNIVVVECDAETLADRISHDVDVQIPNFAIDYITERDEKLVSFGVEENKASFFFEDGSQVTTQLFVQKMPEQVSKILFDLGAYDEEQGFFLTEEWRGAYSSVVQLSPESVIIGPTTMVAVKRQATMNVEIATDAPRDTSKPDSHWNPKFLTPVVSLAERIDFGSYPSPSKFYGPGIRGLIVGKIV